MDNTALAAASVRLHIRPSLLPDCGRPAFYRLTHRATACTYLARLMPIEKIRKYNRLEEETGHLPVQIICLGEQKLPDARWHL